MFFDKQKIFKALDEQENYKDDNLEIFLNEEDYDSIVVTHGVEFSAVIDRHERHVLIDAAQEGSKEQMELSSILIAYARKNNMRVYVEQLVNFERG